MNRPLDKDRGSDVKAWVTIVVIDILATAVICGLFYWLSSTTS